MENLILEFVVVVAVAAYVAITAYVILFYHEIGPPIP